MSMIFKRSLVFDFLMIGAITVNTAHAQYNKILVIGNSLTHHAPLTGADGLTWEGDWGMAASQESKDYVHLLHSMLQADQAETPLELQIAHIDDEVTTFSGYSHLLNIGADLIIFQLGDNYRGPIDSSFQQAFENMISDVSDGGNNPDLVVASTWGYSPENTLKNSFMALASANQNALYVDISAIYHQPGSLALSESYCEDSWRTSGIGSHPGDTGMARISDVLYTNIETIPEPTTILLLGALCGIKAACRKAKR